jgi:hypothetical protein
LIILFIDNGNDDSSEESLSLETDSEVEINSDFDDDVKEDKDIYWN